ncbi:MAG TPA: CD225/dispanin family protein [Longimicrobiaceae bacterium]|nr:CD225/dispanin family protein [Longimicrobiaceae bacterium]
MAVITCPDCGYEYDATLAACSACGRPNPGAAGVPDAEAGAAEASPAEAAGAAETSGAEAAGAAGGYGGGGPYEGGGPGGPGGPAGPGYGAPGYGGPPAGGATDIPNYLVQAILLTLCCCPLVGIVAIVKATQVNARRDAGDIAGAWDSSKEAKKWCWISLGVGIVSHLVMWTLAGAWFMAIVRAASTGAQS